MLKRFNTRRFRIAAIAVPILAAVTVVSLVHTGTPSASGPSPTVVVSNAAPLAKGAPPVPTGSTLKALIDKFGHQDPPDSNPVSMQIVPTTRGAASQAAFGGDSARPGSAVYLVIVHGSFSWLHGRHSPFDQTANYPTVSRKLLLVDADAVRIGGDWGATEVELGNTAPDLSSLGPVTTVTNLPQVAP